MSDDHLSTETSAGFDLTPTGVQAKAKSRLIAAVDRMLGNVVDLINPALEGPAVRQRARIGQDVKLIEKLGDKRVEMVDADPEFASAAMKQQLKTDVRRLENKAAVVVHALEDLRQVPPTEDENSTGDTDLDDAFVNRFERYAEDASSEQLRERWGRVLAAEIRKPGTFSAKVLRIVDELDSSTAELFERLCAHRIDNVLIGCLTGKLPFSDEKRLAAAGLIFDTGTFPQISKSRQSTDTEDLALNVLALGDRAIAFRSGDVISTIGTDVSASLLLQDEAPSIPVYILTDEGHAISSILPADEDQVFESYLARLRADFPHVWMRSYRGDGKNYSLVESWNNDTQPPVSFG